MHISTVIRVGFEMTGKRNRAHNAMKKELLESKPFIFNKSRLKSMQTCRAELFEVIGCKSRSKKLTKASKFVLGVR